MVEASGGKAQRAIRTRTSNESRVNPNDSLRRTSRQRGALGSARSVLASLVRAASAASQANEQGETERENDNSKF